MAKNAPTKSAQTKVGNYHLVKAPFPGYRAREDKTIQTQQQPLGTLVSPSQNVITKTSGRVALVQGYALDGSGSTVIDSGILSNYDFTNFKGDVRNMRAGFLTAAANDGKLQYRYAPSTTVNWVTLASSLTNVRLAYTTYWDNVELKKLMLWVDGTNNINEWNGAVTTFASASNNTTLSIVGNSASLTGYGAITGTAPFTYITNNLTGTAQRSAITFTGNPTNGQTLVFNINSAAQSVQFVTTIGAVAGNVLIAGTAAGTLTNLLGLLNAPGSTTANQVAFSGGDQTTIGYLTAAATNTITKQGTLTWDQEGFYQTRNKVVVINGTSYTYTSGDYSTTLTGVTPDPTLGGFAAGTIVHQAPITTALSSMSSILSTLAPTIIGCGRRNQVYVGSSSSNSLYISKVNSYTDYGFTTPTRVVGEGALIPLDSPPTIFIPLENRNDQNAYDMYISEGTDTWAVIRATLSSDLTKETLEHIRMKVAPLQGAKSNRLATKMKNHIMFVGNDNVANLLGYLSYQNIPELVDFSYPIIDDMASYDFTDGSMFYHRNYAYLTVPKSGLIRIYNMTDQTKQTTSSIRGIEDVDADQPWFWEAPITYPISGFYVVNGDLYGHSYTTSESYKLFTTGSFNGQQIDANATFLYNDGGERTQSKGSTELWIEGYIKQNTTLTATVSGDLNGFMSSQTVTVVGNDNSIVSFGSGGHALGANNLGSQPLGGAATSTTTLPAWFHVAKTYNEVPSYLEQIAFATKGVDLQWELICFGTNAQLTPEGNNSITQ